MDASPSRRSMTASANGFVPNIFAGPRVGEELLTSTVIDLLKTQVKAHPDAIATVEQGKHRTYQQVLDEATQIARSLHSLGVMPGTAVAIMSEHCADVVAGILGILLSGGVYVPIDPEYPDSRQEFIIVDARPAVLLTQQRLLEKVSRYNIPIVILGEPSAAVAQEKVTSPVLRADDWAALFYTSGTTGEPKGVMLTHANLVTLTVAAQREFRLGPEDRVLQAASLSFSAALEEFFPALLAGATLVFPGDRKAVTAVSMLTRLLEHDAVTVFGVTTAHWRVCFRSFRFTQPSCRLQCDW